MKKLLSSLLCLFAFQVVYSQTADPSAGCAPLVVTFAPPAGSTTFFWDLGVNGATSTDPNPSQPYVDPGVYTATFRETPGGPVIGTVSIQVYAKPVIQIAGDPTSGCRPLMVEFTNNTVVDPNIPITGWQWVFGDGTAANTQNAAHTYGSAGTFTVSLELVSGFQTCNKTEIFPDYIKTSNPPLVNFTTNPSPPASCTAPLTVSFTNTSAAGLSLAWDFGNGTTSTDPNPPPVTYTDIGIYTVTLTGTNALGCSSTKTVQVSVGPPLSEFALPDTVCAGTPIAPDNTSSAGMYAWNFGTGASPQMSSAFEPQVTFSEQGLAMVSLTVTTGACSTTVSKNIYVEKLDPSFSIDPLFACEYPFDVQLMANPVSGTMYNWIFPDGSTSDEQNPVYTVGPPSENPWYIEKDTHAYQFKLEITSAAGCVFQDMATITSFAPTAKFEVDVVDGCAPLTVTFKDSSLVQTEIVQWEWHFGDGTVIPAANADPIAHIYQNAGEYDAFLVVTNALGCRDTSYLQPILVGTELMPDFAVDKVEICPGDSIHFTSLIDDPRIDAWHFYSDRGRTWHCFQEDALTWTFAAEAGDPIDASLTVEYNGCSSTIVKEDLITVNGPIARIDYSMDCADPYSYAFADSSYDATGVTWYFGDSTQSNQPFITHTYDTRDSFVVILEAENVNSGCPVSRDTAVIYVRDIKAVFELDTVLCDNLSYVLDGSASQDVDANCYRGYTWLFSHGRPITTSSDTISYSFPGPEDDQWVALEVTDINGCRDTAFLDVKVYELRADFENDVDRICFPDEVNFTDLSTGDAPVVSWSWMFGDMTTSDVQNPTHQYLDNPGAPSGDLTVILTVMDSVGCPATAQAQISYYTPFSNITASPIPNICVGQSVNFSATDFTQEGSNLTWAWDLGNSQTATGQTASATYLQDGQFTVHLVFEEIASQCVDSTTTVVNVQSYPVAAFTSDFDNLPPPICYPKNADFLNTSASDYPLALQQWDFGNGQTATGNNPSASFGKGTFEVTMIVGTSFGCRDTFTNEYTLVGPEGDFDISANTICAGGEVTVSLKDTLDLSSFIWNFGDGTNVPDADPVTHTYDPSLTGNVTILLILKGENDACTLEPVPTETIAIVKPEALFSVTDPNGGVCLGEPFVFQNGSLLADSYQWNFGDGGNASSTNPNHIYSSPGNYTVQLTAINTSLNCRDSTTLDLQVFEAPQPTVEGTEVCNGEPAMLNVAGSVQGSSYVWSPAALFPGGANTGEMVTTVPLTQNTSLSIVETTPDGCEGTVQLDIVVVPVLTTAKDTLSTCVDVPVSLSVPESEFYNYQWSPAEGLSCTDCTEAVLTTAATTTVYALPEDIYGLGCTRDTFVFRVVVPENQIEVPNAFSPNNDGTNDVFNFVVDDAIRDELTVKVFNVFNRFGQKVYSNEDPISGWNGEQKGKPAASDVYVYLIEVYLGDCLLGKFSGDVTLLR
ncbi:MAG: PKD domain-containing protein [Saprospiraceae bacterium]